MHLNAIHAPPDFSCYKLQINLWTILAVKLVKVKALKCQQEFA